MINLLPEEEKQSIRAARTNVVLLRYNLVTLGAVATLVAFCALFYVILYNNQQKALAASNGNDAKTASLGKVRTDADNYRKNLTVAKTILNNGISYTNIIIAITKLLPTGTVLDGITLSSGSFNQQTKFQAHASSYTVAEQLKQNFQTSKIFSNVYFEALTLASDGGASTKGYPVSLTIDATLNQSGAFHEE